MTDIESLVARLRDAANGIGGLKSAHGDYGLLDDAADAIRTLQTEKVELREALLPFAELAGGDVNMNDPLRKWLTVAHLFEARQALSNTGEIG